MLEDAHSAATAAMSATAAPPRLILMLSAPLDALAAAVEEAVLEAEAPADVVAAADWRVVGREIDGLAERIELLLNGEPVEKTSDGAEVVNEAEAVALPAIVGRAEADPFAEVLGATEPLLALLLLDPPAL